MNKKTPILHTPTLLADSLSSQHGWKSNEKKTAMRKGTRRIHFYTSDFALYDGSDLIGKFPYNTEDPLLPYFLHH